MAIGVVAFWAGIGIPAALFTAAADPSRIFGIWWLTLGIGLLIALMGVGIMGLFTIQLPAAAYAVNPKADTAWGSFLFGVMTGVLGLPCFGFVAGALLAGSATLPPATIMIIFTSMGVGMAAPYLVLAAKPSLVERIPRTGPASELVKQVMGLLLLAAAAYFIGSGLIALVIDYPYLAKQLHWWVVALCAVLLVWLADKDLRFVECAVLALGLLVFFWLADAQNFYYQRKTRRGIAAALGRARLARGLGSSVSPLGLEKDAVNSVLSSLLNPSQAFYFYIGVAVLVALALTHHA